ncbi:MAG: hypothetical protein HQK69_09950, partial [Desulfamplus sp.]|nr:hypothetical protein [Desulfamplus sp.]
MRNLILICLLIFIGVGITQNCFAELGYPSIYKNINYKEHFNADTLLKTNSVYPSIDQTKSYETDYAELRTFKAFFPKGAKKLTLLIDFIGWPWQRCDQGATIKYWIGNNIPSEKGQTGNDLWNGKYIEKISGAQDTTIGISSKDSQPSETAVWIYFEVHNP